MVEKRGLLMREFGWSLKHVKFGMTGAEGWIWYNWARENLVTAFGPIYKRTSDGYIRQETKRLVAVAKDHYAKKKLKK